MTKILVIEDEPSLREEIVDILDVEGFNGLSAGDGASGLHLAQTESPDLILCDIMLPEKSGYEILSSLQQSPSTVLIPIIFITAKSSHDDIRQGMNLGADDYLTKPFTTKELLDSITARLAKRDPILQIHKKVEELQHSNLLKDNFLGIASQKMREPSTNIMMALRLLRQATSHNQTQRYVDILQQECSREINLINSLVELHRLENNERPIQLESINLQTWMPAIAQPFQAIAQQRQQGFWNNIPPYLPTLLTDASDLKQIVSELLNNACKYTDSGGKIVLESRCDLNTAESAENTDQQVTLIVSNEAKIPENLITNLFQPFYRIPEIDRWKEGGNGLGLTLVEKLTTRLGGSIRVKSNSGWTQMLIQLPVQVNSPGISVAKFVAN
ncbi:MAG: response regulator [Elainellaceae cyanobacterium]